MGFHEVVRIIIIYSQLIKLPFAKKWQFVMLYKNCHLPKNGNLLFCEKIAICQKMAICYSMEKLPFAKKVQFVIP